jgi:hypothetical protein
MRSTPQRRVPQLLSYREKFSGWYQAITSVWFSICVFWHVKPRNFADMWQICVKPSAFFLTAEEHAALEKW